MVGRRLGATPVGGWNRPAGCAGWAGDRRFPLPLPRL